MKYLIKTKFTLLIAGIGAILFCGANLRANSPADFLEADSDARSHSMGGANAADAEGYSAFNRNPSVLAVSSRTTVNTTVGMKPLGIKAVQASFSKDIRNKTVGIHLINVMYPSQTAYNENGVAAGEVSSSDLGILFGLGRTVGPLMFGVSSTYVYKKIAGATGYGLAMTGAIQYEIARRLSWGLIANDLKVIGIDFEGTKENFPTQFRTGLKCRMMDRDNFNLQVLADLINRENHYDIDIGGELNLNEAFFLRGGFSTRSKGGRIGLGIWFKKMRLDWGMQLSPLNDRKEMMVFSIGYRF